MQALWQIPFDSISVNGNDVSVSTKEAVIDTGTSVILGNKGDIANIYSNIPGSAQMSNGIQWTSTHVTGLVVRKANRFTCKC